MTCNIVLQNFQGTYYPGNTISGHLVCTFPSSESIRGIRVKLRGKEHTDWVERESYYDSHSKKTKYRNVHYSGDNKFLAVDLTLVGERTMSSGRYEYPFTFSLPMNLPMNFQGSYGYVKYFIKGTVDIPFAFDYEDERYFNVQSPIDFNIIRSELQMEPTIYQDEKTICCLCCASGPITLDVTLEKEAFILGETAKIKIDVTNLSNKNVEEMNLKVTMVIESKATSPRTHYKYDKELVTSNSDTGVGAHGQRTYDFDLNIPSSTALYNFARCTLFKQYFVFKVEAALPGCHCDMDIETNIVLGHIPLAGGLHQPSQLIHHPTSEIPGGPFSPPPAYVPDNEPPPYAASDKVPPYPTGPPAFPVPSGTPGEIGFSLPPGSGAPQIPILPSIGMPPVPVHGAPYPPGPGSSAAAANAPPAESTPSAPTKAEIAEEEDFDMIYTEDRSNGPTEPPPPTYGNAVRAPFASTPGVAGVYPPGVYPPGVYPPDPASHNGPSAPPPK